MNLLKKGIYFLFAATVIVACSDDDDTPVGPIDTCLLYTSPSPRDPKTSRMPSSA